MCCVNFIVFVLNGNFEKFSFGQFIVNMCLLLKEVFKINILWEQGIILLMFVIYIIDIWYGE